MSVVRKIMHKSERYQISKYLNIISNSRNQIPKFILLISRLTDIIQKCFCTSDLAMDPTFQVKYVPSFYHVSSQRDWANNSLGEGTPCYQNCLKRYLLFQWQIRLYSTQWFHHLITNNMNEWCSVLCQDAHKANLINVLFVNSVSCVLLWNKCWSLC